jgi:chromosome segregation ATPase
LDFGEELIPVTASSLQENVATLQQQLDQRNQLVHQLSQELFHRVVPQRGRQQVFEYLLRAQAQEIQRLKARLNQYSHLVNQLSAELFHRLHQERRVDAGTVVALQGQIEKLQGELRQAQQDVQRREQELVQVHGSLVSARERNQNLETILRDLPEVYRRRFNARLAPVKEQLAKLQEENRRLQGELQRYGALTQTTTKREPASSIDLPKFPPLQAVSRVVS